MGSVEEKIDDYYTKVNCHNKAMGLWALYYAQSEKMIKKEKECNEEEDNNSTISNWKRKDMGPWICITTSHISTFLSYLRHLQDIHWKYCHVLMLRSGSIKQAIMDDRNKKSLNPIEIMEEDVGDGCWTCSRSQWIHANGMGISVKNLITFSLHSLVFTLHCHRISL